MIGIIVITHGGLASALLSAALHVVGPQERVKAVAIEPEDDIDERRAEILDMVRSLDDGSGVIVLTDIFGGTPSNLAISLMKKRPDMEVLAGANLPMLIELAQVRDTKDLKAAAASAIDAGRRYIESASVLLSRG